MKRLALPFLCLALLGGCESAGGAPPVGPSVTRIDADHYRVTFRGPSGVSGEEVSDRALLQAAQLTVMQGYDWMRVTGRALSPAPATTPHFSIGIGGASFGRGSAVGVGASQGFGGEVSFVADLEVQFGKGPRPTDPNVYDAHGVIASLGRSLAPPPPPPR